MDLSKNSEDMIGCAAIFLSTRTLLSVNMQTVFTLIIRIPYVRNIHFFNLEKVRFTTC